MNNDREQLTHQPPNQPITLESGQLFAKGKEIRIRHAGDEYRLRLTSNNKLILTK